MKRNLAVATLMLLATLSTSCKGNRGAYEFEIYEGGVSVSQIDLKKESAYQLSYQASLAYPDKEVLNFYKEKLFPVGWKGCRPGGDWDVQLKKDGAQIKGVRQLVSYAIHKKSNRLLMISLQYHSDPIEQVSDKIEWHDDVQYVTLVAYTVKNLDRVLSSLSLSCSE